MFKLLVIIITAFKFVSVECVDWAGEAGAKCPDCTKIRCGEDLSQEDCPDGTHLAQNILFGCCPACIKYLEYGDPCPGMYEDSMRYDEFISTNGKYYPNEFIRDTVELPCSTVHIYDDYSIDNYSLPERVFSAYWVNSIRDIGKQIPVINSARCSPKHRCFLTFSELASYDYPICMLEANFNENNDFVTTPYADIPCKYKKADYRVYEEANDCSVRYWDPNCNVEEGTFAPVQSKSDELFLWCSTPSGSKLFGKERQAQAGADINCLCSRKRWELQQSKMFSANNQAALNVNGRSDLSLHCEMNGNYEELQCDKERCWCMDPDTGKPLSKVVPESLVKFLPCYDRSVFEEKTTSNQYLRKCEARSVGLQRTAFQLRLRGTAWLVSDPVLCDATGGFDRTYCDSSSGACYCVDKTGQRSAYFFTNTGTVSSSCSCARDFIDGIITNVRCDGYGNYPTLQKSTASNGWEVDYCADSEDGWRLSGQVPGLANKPGGGTKPCCLNSTAVDHSYQVQSPPEYQGFFQCRASVTECDSDPNNCVKYMKDCSFSEQ